MGEVRKGKRRSEGSTEETLKGLIPACKEDLKKKEKQRTEIN